MRCAAQRELLTQIWRAGITDKNVSPQWFRPAHARHALEVGAAITLVRDTLGQSHLTTTSR